MEQDRFHRHHLSQELAQLAEFCGGEKVTLRQLTQAVEHRGHALMAFFLCFPFLTPIPIPGLSIFMGACIAIVGMQYARGKKVWFPKSWMDKPFPASFLRKIFQLAERVMKKVEVFIKPRGKFIHNHPWVRTVTGTMIAACGLLLALPLPPGTNFPPASAIIFLSVGSLEEDGVLIIIGYVLFLINIALFSLIPILGFEGIKSLFS